MSNKNTSCQTNDDLNRLFTLISDGYDSYSSDEDEDEYDNENSWPFQELDFKINNIDDLINLGELYDPKLKVRYNIDIKRISKIVPALLKLKNMIGLNNIKEKIVDQIIYFIANLEDKTNDMMHTIITGPPGVGKTKLGKIIGDIYYNLDILTPIKKKRKRSTNYVFKIVKRSDLIGKYLGHTAAKTQSVIDSCDGGVMFIDEAYSLGNSNCSDSFSKECIDTINQNLTEKKNNFLCIIAGYEDALDSSFFSYNEGLKRRFTFKYNIDKYTDEELKLIFFQMVKEINWSIEDNINISKLFIDNYELFENMAGDMESLLFNCKIAHAKRIIYNPNNKKTITYEDIQNGLKVFKENRLKKTTNNWKSLYI